MSLPTADQFILLFLTGPHSIIQNQNGESIGTQSDGTQVNSIRNGFQGPLEDAAGMIYLLPRKDDYTVHLGEPNTDSKDVTTFVMGSEFSASITSPSDTLSNLDEISYTNTRQSITYRVIKDQRIDLNIYMDSKNQGYKIHLAEVNIKGGQPFSAKAENGQLILSGLPSGNFNFEMTRSSKEGVAIFTYPQVETKNGENYRYAIETWDGSGSFPIQIDKNNDGKSDQVKYLQNAETQHSKLWIGIFILALGIAFIAFGVIFLLPKRNKI